MADIPLAKMIDLVSAAQNTTKAINNLSQTLSALYPLIFTNAPSTAASDGSPGQIAVDSSYLYLCVAVDTWKRVAIATW